MARARDRLAENAPGDFYVDSSCIDCDLCRQLAPAVFGRTRDRSYVAHQPADEQAQHRALMALVTCPTSSIGREPARASIGREPARAPSGTLRKLDSRRAARAFPEHVAANVYFCGWAAESSYGASAWLIRREDGNVLVDSPRTSSTLMQRLEELGGVRFMVLTHRDDVADHAAYHDRFGCERIIHRADATIAAERILDGSGPIDLAPDLRVVPVPGHTRGSIVLIASETFAFTGDHVWADDAETGLDAGRDVCWYSWPEQKRSMQRLAEYRFTHVLPGHGRRFHAATPEAMRAAVLALAEAM